VSKTSLVETAPDQQDETLDGRTPSPRAAGEPPARIDRYLILGTVGEGAMGIVYRAFDPDLDRKVALKLRNDRWSSQGNRAARFLREAQSLARLKHPNVVTVYDIGFVADQMFISMELVDGMPLSGWVKAQPRGWRETLAVAIGVGRGLAAAHAAGLVHRDVKPDNILIGKDGISRIADFGLARMVGDDAAEPDGDASVDPPSPSPHSVLAEPLTRTGSILGTPSYMAPEQAVGAPPDARGDQFSFCVAFYEALYGEHPFDTSNQAALQAAICAGAIRPAPRGTAVPAWVREPLLVGLSADPDRRHASMSALLRALENDPAPRRRTILAALAVAGLVVAGALGAWKASSTGSEQLVSGIWDPPRRQALDAAFRATGSPLAAFTSGEVTRRLDRYAAELVAMHRDTCAATQIRREQSQAMQELRTRCVDQRLGALRALTGLFVQADTQIVHNAVTAAGSLPGIADCGDAAALQQVQPEPVDLEIRTRIAALRPALARVGALTQAAKYAEAAPLAERAWSDARAVGWRPLEAEAAFLRGNVESFRGHLDAAAAALEDALWSAEMAHADVLAARAATLLLSVATARGRLDEAHRWERQATAAVERAGDELVRSTYDLKVGRLRQDEGHPDEALTWAERAHAIRERTLGPDDTRTAEALYAIGDARSFQFKAAEAVTSYRRAMAIYEQRLGTEHPQIALMWSKLGNLAWDQGRFQEALDDHKRAIAIRERTLEPDNPMLAASYNNAGIASDDLHRYDEALQYYGRALAIRNKTQDPDHPDMLALRNNIGGAYIALERWDEARAELTDVLRLKEHKLGRDHASVAETLVNLGHIELHFGRIAAAEADTVRAQAIAAKESDPDRRMVGALHAQLASIRAAQGRTDEARALAAQAIGELTIAGEADQPDLAEPLELHARLSKAPADAIPMLERALAIHERTDAPGSRAAIQREQTRFALARALLSAGVDRPRARALAEQARSALAAAHDPGVRAIEAWLARTR
jgi:serine/threonine protein kinase/tetratricopeptide (TPR) repeat protein